MAFYNGIMHEVIANDWVDREFIAQRVTNYGELAKTVRQYPPERAAQICGVDADTIREVARLWGRPRRRRHLLGHGDLPAHHRHRQRALPDRHVLDHGERGPAGHRAAPAARPEQRAGRVRRRADPDVLSDYQLVTLDEAREKFAEAWGVTELDPERGLTVTEIIASALQGGVRGMYMMGENPFLSDPNVNKVRKALSALEFLVVQDIFLTETAEFADVDPPGHLVHGEGGHLHEHRPPRADRAQGARAARRGALDWKIGCDIATRIGLPMDYRSPSEVFDELVSLMPNYAGLSYDNLGATGKLYPNPDPEHSDGTVVLFDERFGTDDGRRISCPPSGCRQRSCRTTSSRSSSTPGRLLEHWHTGSMTRRSYALDAIQPEAHVLPEPGRRGRDGRRRGRLRRPHVAARFDRAVRPSLHRDTPGTCFIPFHFREAAANVLTIDEIDPDREDPGVQVLRGPRVEPGGCGRQLARPAPRPGPGASRAQPDPGASRDPARARLAAARGARGALARASAARSTRSRG